MANKLERFNEFVQTIPRDERGLFSSESLTIISGKLRELSEADDQASGDSIRIMTEYFGVMARLCAMTDLRDRIATAILDEYSGDHHSALRVAEYILKLVEESRRR